MLLNPSISYVATIAGVGMSRHHNSSVAGREAAEQALRNAGIAKPDFVFMFASIGYDQHSLVRAVRETTGGAPLTGCSAEDTINGDDADESGFSVVVTVISSDELHWTNGIVSGLEDDARAVGKRVAQDLLPHLSPSTIGLFVFPDGRIDILNNFFAGLQENLSGERFLPLWGGGAGNYFNLGQPPYQYADTNGAGMLPKVRVFVDGKNYALNNVLDQQVTSSYTTLTADLTRSADKAAGTHTIHVKMANWDTGDEIWVDWTAFTYIPAADTTAPDTTLGSADLTTTDDNTPTFTFSGSDKVGVTGFECRVDTAAFATCVSPYTTDALSDGSHTFDVRAKDAAGNIDPSPASQTFSVDTTPGPAAPTIASGPVAGSTNTDGNFSFAFTGAEASGTYQCSLDTGTANYSSCTSPRSYTNQTNGSYTFRVRQVDALGNVGTAATRSFSVAISPTGTPVSVIDYGATPGDASNDTVAFQNAANAAGTGEYVYVPNLNGAYRVALVDLPSNTTVKFASGAVLKKFGTNQGPLFKIQGPDKTTFAQNIYMEGVGGNFTMDLSDAGQRTGAITYLNVRNFSLKNAICIQNNDNQLQEAPSSRRPCLSFNPSNTTQRSDGTYNQPTDGTFTNVQSKQSPYGWGLVQTTGGANLSFTDISSEGGVPLRLENYSNGWTPMKNITADGVTCRNGRDAVHWNAHGAIHPGPFTVKNVTADSCESAISIAGGGSYGPNSSVDGVTVIPGNQAQVRDSDTTRYSGAWDKAPSKWCVDNRATSYTINLSNVDCGGLPNRRP